MPIIVRTAEGQTAASLQNLGRHFAHEPFGELAFAWSDLVRRAHPTDVEVQILLAERERRLRAAAVVHRAPGLDVSSYGPGRLRRVAETLSAYGANPLRSTASFVEIPLTNRPGLLFAADAEEPERFAAARSLLRHICASSRSDMVLVKGNAEADLPQGPGLSGVRIGWLDDTWLPFPFESFRAFVRSRAKKRRWQIRTDLARFAECGGRIEIADDASARAGALVQLYRRTVDEARNRGDPTPPTGLNEAFVAGIGSLRGVQIAIATLDGSPCAFLILARSGSTLFVRQAGLDYERSRKSGAYFRLFYAALEHAARLGCRGVDLGPSAYPFKERLGGHRCPTSYLLLPTSRKLRLVAPLLKRLL